MKRTYLLILIACVTMLSGCSQASMSNLDIQKLNNVAREYMDKEDYPEAIMRLRAINDLNPNFPQTYYNLGVAYQKNQDWDLSIESFQKAIELKPDFELAYYGLAVVQEDKAYYLLEFAENVKEKKNPPLEKEENGELEKRPNIVIPENPKQAGLETLAEARKNYQTFVGKTKSPRDKADVLEKIAQINRDIAAKETPNQPED